MGALQGNLSFSRFFVQGELPDNHQTKFLRNARAAVFQQLSHDDESDASVGWCAPGDLLDLELTRDKLFVDSYMRLGLRTDRWRIPKPVYDNEFRLAAEEVLAKSGRERLSKTQRDEVSFWVKKRLRKKVLPSMKSIDLVWNTETGVLLFWNQSARTLEDFMARFEHSFGMQLLPDCPFVAATKLGLDDQRLEALNGVGESWFGVGRPRIALAVD